MESMTKRRIKQIAGVESDRGLALWWQDSLGFSITPQAVNKWPDDAPLPELRVYQLRDRGILPERDTA